jgi:biopolymer transport protein ExbB/TolQ
MFTADNLAASLRAVATALGTPVMFLLLVMAAATIFMAGTLIAELFFERIRRKINVADILSKLRDADMPVSEIINDSAFLRRQKRVILKLCSHGDMTTDMRESLARRLLHEEQARNRRIVRITDIIARLGPMLGLLGTLIPLGPGLIALGQGDTFTLSRSLISAFDTTVAGLASAAIAFVVSNIRKSWYENDLSAMEAVMECLLESDAENPKEALYVMTANKKMEAGNA